MGPEAGFQYVGEPDEAAECRYNCVISELSERSTVNHTLDILLILSKPESVEIANKIKVSFRYGVAVLVGARADQFL